jgi:hypothetical protein
MSKNDRDYSKEDYAARDPIEVVYNLADRNFSYRNRSELLFNGKLSKMHYTFSIAKADVQKVNSVAAIEIPRGARRVNFEDPWNTKEFVVELPKRVLAGRMLQKFKTLYVERG